MVKDNFNYSVSVDCVIFGYDDINLKVLLIKRGVNPYKEFWALPGDLVHPKESIDDAVDPSTCRFNWSWKCLHTASKDIWRHWKTPIRQGFHHISLQFDKN